MYTMLQDTILKKLDPRQREIFALGRFETLIDMPGNNFKFSMKSEAIEGKVYIDKWRRYDAFKVFLDRTDIPAAFAELDDRTKRYPGVTIQRDPEWTATGETLRFKQLLYLYKKWQK